ncbi:MAG: uncharacterized protein QOI20_1979 [Acidimicrobiaceae bacterium]|jgi:carbon monoxide dehydrogenase subunit G|nr:uncharacterized protein [Acidimicrobiaceae bacterium]
MELTNEFRVSVPVEQAWAVLTDVERIAPCMPGAELQEVEGDEYRGVVKVKVGPITAQYKGKARFEERDEAVRRLVLRAEGRDTRGAGNANATVTALLVPDGDGTKVSVVTDLAVTGKVAQFGRGVLADVSAKLLGQFVECLESTVLAGSGSSAGEAGAEGEGEGEGEGEAGGEGEGEAGGEAGPRRIESAPARPVDLFDAAGGSMAKRALPVVSIVVVLWLLLRRRRRG